LTTQQSGAKLGLSGIKTKTLVKHPKRSKTNYKKTKNSVVPLNSRKKWPDKSKTKKLPKASLRVE
jgi:hypothetical protein